MTGPTRRIRAGARRDQDERTAAVEGREPRDAQPDAQRAAEPAEDPMPVFTLKAKDKLALLAVQHYELLCRERGLDDQADEVVKAIDEMAEWRHRHRSLVRLSDHPHVPATQPEVRLYREDDPAIAVLGEEIDNNTAWGVVPVDDRVRVAVAASDVRLLPERAEALAAALIRAARKAREAREVTRG